MSITEKSELIQQIDTALEGIRPHLKVDGGDVEVVNVTDDMKVQIKWLGNCQNCNMSAITMKAGLEQAIMGKIPGILSVEAIN